jgi:hypothetical protein
VRHGAAHWSATGVFTATGSPVIAAGDGKTVIAARGAADGTIWFCVLGFPGWTATGPARVFRGSSDPAVGVNSAGQVTIADRGEDNTIWYVQPGLHGWSSTGNFKAAGNPSLAENDGHTVIAALASDGTIWYTELGSGSWTPTGSTGSFQGASDPTAAVSRSGQVTIADRGRDNAVWYVQPGLHGWRSSGPFLASGNPAIGENGGRIVIAARDRGDGTIRFLNLGSRDWTATGSTSDFRGASDPTVAVSPSGNVTIADRGKDDTVWYVEPGLVGWTSLGLFYAAGTPAVVSGSEQMGPASPSAATTP